jgi:hypothetical protein
MKKPSFATYTVVPLSAVALIFSLLTATTGWGADGGNKNGGNKNGGKKQFTTDFRIEDCTFSTTGRNAYFSLNVGDFLKLANDKESVEITVLNQTHTVTLPDIGPITTRVVEEVHRENGEVVETSRNFFARCEQTNDIHYFGETVDPPDIGGEWEAGQDGALPGIIMPATFLLGARYFQEQAPGVALDRAEHTKMGLTVPDPQDAANPFTDCVQVVETTKLERGKSIKRYCPGIGLVFDDGLELVEYDIQ